MVRTSVDGRGPDDGMATPSRNAFFRSRNQE